MVALPGMVSTEKSSSSVRKTAIHTSKKSLLTKIDIYRNIRDDPDDPAWISGYFQ